MSSPKQSGTLPTGFRASGVSARIKKSGKKDFALFYSLSPCVASAMFTTNAVAAAPVVLGKRIIKAGKPVRAIAVNSGNANCMTGQKGIEDAARTAGLLARALQISRNEVLISSTGIIGRLLPMEKIEAAVPYLVEALSKDGLKDAAEAILTTDTFAKVATRTCKVGSKTVRITGVTKGAGMIAPDMIACPAGRHATMLAYIFTDACIGRSALCAATTEAVGQTFNAITIDGCMSTNDTVVVLANACAGNRAIAKGSRDFAAFAAALKAVCLELAQLIVRDAEGATKFISISVRGAASEAAAKDLAMSVANSNLFKCAMFGSDPNWGRIAAALGSAAEHLDWQKMDIILNGQPVFRQGKPVVLKKKDLLKGKLIDVVVDLKSGKAGMSVYTSDLSYEYVRINAEYN